MLNARQDEVVREIVFGKLPDALDAVRQAIRLADYCQAQLHLNQLEDRTVRQTAEYFNLAGAVCEGQKKSRLAEKHYVKSISLSNAYEPARRNLQRLRQIKCTGKSCWATQLGDENHNIWYANVSKH